MPLDAKQLIKAVPSCITLASLCAACLSLISAFSNSPRLALSWLGYAWLLDCLDGRAARLLKAEGDLGRRLDALTDVVTYAIAPSFIIFSEIHDALVLEVCLLVYMSLVITKLAMYLGAHDLGNMSQYPLFGVPTPAAAGVILLVPIIENSIRQDLIANRLFWIYCSTILAIACLLAPVATLSFKSAPSFVPQYARSDIVIPLFILGTLWFPIQSMGLTTIVYFVSVAVNLSAKSNTRSG
jgi:phosphatidylserine synthase